MNWNGREKKESVQIIRVRNVDESNNRKTRERDERIGIQQFKLASLQLVTP